MKINYLEPLFITKTLSKNKDKIEQDNKYGELKIKFQLIFVLDMSNLCEPTNNSIIIYNNSIIVSKYQSKVCQITCIKITFTNLHGGIRRNLIVIRRE